MEIAATRFWCNKSARLAPHAEASLAATHSEADKPSSTSQRWSATFSSATNSSSMFSKSFLSPSKSPSLPIMGYCAQFTDKFHENYFSYIIHIDSGLESNVSAYHRRSVPSSHAFASTLQLHKSASRCISDSS